MRILVTGSRGKVGHATWTCLRARGHDVICTDLGAPVYELPSPGEPHYLRADLTDAGAAFAVVRGVDAVVHTAAIPQPDHDVPHVVFRNNLMATFNVVEAAVRSGVRRLVHVSSECVPGTVFAERPFLPGYLPIDEELEPLPQDAYALSKFFGEQLCDAAVRRSDLTAVSVRASWVQWEGNYQRGPGAVRHSQVPGPTFWSYVDAYDLAELIALAVESGTAGHEVVCAAQPDNVTGRELAPVVRAHFPQVELRPLDRPDASGTSIAKARRLFGWDPRRSWRDYLDDAGLLRVPAPAPGALPTYPGPVSP